MLEQMRQLVEAMAEQRKAAAQEWNNKISELRRDYDDLRTQTRKLTESETHLFW